MVTTAAAPGKRAELPCVKPAPCRRRSMREFMTRPGFRYRVMSVALGFAFIAVGLLFGLDRQFTNWGLVAVLVAAGALLAVSGLLVPARYLTALFAVCLILNIVLAAYALLFSPPAH
jgi:hypothetical protein